MSSLAIRSASKFVVLSARAFYARCITPSGAIDKALANFTINELVIDAFRTLMYCIADVLALRAVHTLACGRVGKLSKATLVRRARVVDNLSGKNTCAWCARSGTQL